MRTDPAEPTAAPPRCAPAGPADRPRHAGWAALAGMLGAAFLVMGVTLVAMLQAPVVRPRVVAAGLVLIAGGLVLLAVAWLGRRSSKP